MKHAILSFALISVAFAKAQEVKTVRISDEVTDHPILETPHFVSDNDDNKIFNVVSEMPEFPGGKKAFDDFFAQHSKMPENAETKGMIIATFVVEKDGSVTGLKIMRDLGFGIGNETLRVLTKMPKWKPGKNGDRIVRCVYNLPIRIPVITPNSTDNKK